jgi:hypothetical protein
MYHNSVVSVTFFVSMWQMYIKPAKACSTLDVATYMLAFKVWLSKCLFFIEVSVCGRLWSNEWNRSLAHFSCRWINWTAKKSWAALRTFKIWPLLKKLFFTFLCYYGNFAHLSAFYHSAIWLHCQFQALGKMTRLPISPHNSMWHLSHIFFFQSGAHIRRYVHNKVENRVAEIQNVSKLLKKSISSDPSRQSPAVDSQVV